MRNNSASFANLIKNLGRLLFGIFLFSFGYASEAFSIFPEYQGLSEEEAQEIQLPHKINSEYSSDYLTYLKPFSWERDFWNHTNAFDLSTGSISSNEFQMQDRLKLRQWLVPDQLEFRFTYFSERDFEKDQDHKVLELAQKLSSKWFVSAYGETSLYKAEDDVGAALEYKPDSHSVIRLFHTWVDYSRNKRNSKEDRFSIPPTSYGIVGRVFLRDWFLKFSAVHSPFSRWKFPDEERIYDHQEWESQLHIQKNSQDGSYWAGEIQSDQFYESQSPDSTTSSTASHSLLRRRIFLRTERRHSWGRYFLRPGIAYFYRDYKYDQDRILFRDMAPFIGFGWPEKSYSYFEWGNELSLEMTRHRAQQTSALLESTPRSIANEFRGNWRSLFKFKEQGELALLFTFDLDEFGTELTWEGGNAQFRFYF